MDIEPCRHTTGPKQTVIHTGVFDGSRPVPIPAMDPTRRKIQKTPSLPKEQRGEFLRGTTLFPRTVPGICNPENLILRAFMPGNGQQPASPTFRFNRSSFPGSSDMIRSIERRSFQRCSSGVNFFENMSGQLSAPIRKEPFYQPHFVPLSNQAPDHLSSLCEHSLLSLTVRHHCFFNICSSLTHFLFLSRAKKQP